MGSIAGYWSKKESRAVIPDLTNGMIRAAPYRGPHADHFRCGDGMQIDVGFDGILAKSRAEAFDESAGIRVVMDGVLFSCSDAENEKIAEEDARQVLRLYLRHKEDFLSKIDGSFSLALHDCKQKKLILARDRLGTKPLFYYAREDCVVFGSETKMVLQSGMLEKRVNLSAIDCLLSYGYIPCPLTMFEGIHQVKPGHLMIFDKDGAKEQEYWKFKYNPARRKEPIEHLAREFLDVFEKSVRRRLDRFPEAGAFLSGGLDTSSVVAVMRRIKGAPFKVFTAGFQEESFNEIEDARIVADHLDVNLITTVINYEDGFADLLEKIVWHHDSPFADTSAIPSYYAAKLAREHSNTVLTGDFPDQLIGGSGHQVKALSRETSDGILLKGLRGLRLNRFARRFPLKAGGTSLPDKVKRFIYRESFSLEEQRVLANMPVPPLLKRCLYSRDLMNANARFDPLDVASSLYREVEKESLLDRILYFDTLSYAPDDLMVKVERMTAAHGLNAFSPFHDKDLVEFVASLAPEMKIRGNERKFIVRQAMRPLLPEHTMSKRKQGFAMPIGEWLVRNLADYVRHILLDSRTLNRGYFDKRFMRRMIESFLVGKADYASGSESTIVCLLTLELWHRLFMDS
jgi:asparagine synthase (glutamine-hydrolysing)